MEQSNREQLDPKITKFCSMLLSKKGMDNMPEDIKASMLLDLYVRFQTWVNTASVEALPKEKLEAFDEFMQTQEDPDNPNAAEYEAFMLENVPNYKEVLEKAMIDFANSYLGTDSKQ